MDRIISHKNICNLPMKHTSVATQTVQELSFPTIIQVLPVLTVPVPSTDLANEQSCLNIFVSKMSASDSQIIIPKGNSSSPSIFQVSLPNSSLHNGAPCNASVDNLHLEGQHASGLLPQILPLLSLDPVVRSDCTVTGIDGSQSLLKDTSAQNIMEVKINDIDERISKQLTDPPISQCEVILEEENGDIKYMWENCLDINFESEFDKIHHNDIVYLDHDYSLKTDKKAGFCKILESQRFPKGYHYRAISAFLFRTKFHTKDEVKEWIEKFKKNNVNWRVRNTYPKAGKVNIFKCGYRCQHFTRWSTGKRKSKNTGCPCELTVVIRRNKFKQKSRSKNPDPLANKWPCIVKITGSHNHSFDSEVMLRYQKDLNTKN